MTRLHYAVESELFGPYETEMVPACGYDFRRTKKLTDDPALVTCPTCRKLCGFGELPVEEAEPVRRAA
jgi:hypothetical protein